MYGNGVTRTFALVGFHSTMIGNQPHLSDFIFKIVVVLYSLGSCSFVYWRGVVIELKRASRLDAFVVHFRVGVFEDRFRVHLLQTDYLLIVELNTSATFERKKLSANCDPLSNVCLRQLRSRRGDFGVGNIPCHDPHLRGLFFKVIVIVLPQRGSRWVQWYGIVKEPESASHLDGFAVHSSERVIETRLRGRADQTDCLATVEPDALAALEHEKLSANCDSFSRE